MFTKLSLATVFFLLFTFSKADDFQVPEAQWPEDIQQLRSENLKLKSFTGSEGLKNVYEHYHREGNPIQNPLIILSGLEDYLPMWSLVAQNFIQVGFSDIFVVNLRGQGLAEKDSFNKKNIIHVDYFDQYVEDYMSFYDALEKSGLDFHGKSPFLMAHSTGGAVLMKSLVRLKAEHPKFYPEKVSLWTPLVILKVLPLLAQPVFRKSIKTFDRVWARLFGLFQAATFENLSFEKNELTSSQKYYDMNQHYRFNTDHGSPGVSLAWGIAALDALDDLRQNVLPNVEVPTLVLLGEKDSVVINTWENENPLIKKVVIKDAKHGLHFERDEILKQSLSQTLHFFLK